MLSFRLNLGHDLIPFFKWPDIRGLYSLFGAILDARGRMQSGTMGCSLVGALSPQALNQSI